MENDSNGSMNASAKRTARAIDRLKGFFERLRSWVIEAKTKLMAFLSEVKKDIADIEQKRAGRNAARRARREGDGRGGVKNAAVLAVDIALLVIMLASGGMLVWALTMPDERIKVTVEADGDVCEYMVHDVENVGEMMALADVSLGDCDELSHDAGEPLTDGMVISVKRAFPVAVASKDSVTVIKTVGGTVGSVLDSAGVVYDVMDELSNKPFEDVRSGMLITHSDVEISYNVDYRTLDYDEVEIKDDTMYEGKTVVEQKGSDGKKQITQRIVVKDGSEVSREIVDQVVITPAVDELIRVGTKIRYQTNFKGEWRRYREPPTDDMIAEVMYVECTAYSGDGITSRGTKPNLGTIAINPKIIPYYSKIYVPKYGYGTALDTGAFRHYENGTKNQIDLYFNSESEARRWGRKRKYKIYILKSSVYVPRR